MADLKGPKAAFVKLVSSDNHEFIIRKDVALTSGQVVQNINDKLVSISKYDINFQL
jgi:hypothetical protein